MSVYVCCCFYCYASLRELTVIPNSLNRVIDINLTEISIEINLLIVILTYERNPPPPYHTAC